MTPIEKIKLLRDETGLSLSHIKKAVEATHTLDEARVVLSQLRIQDQHDQVAKKGMVRIVSHRNIAVLYEINALTDFVIKHDTFIKFVDDIGEVLIKHPHTNVLGLHDLSIHNQTVEDYRLQVETMIAERVVISRVSTIEKQDQQTFGFYMHHNFSSAAVVILDGHHQNVDEEAIQIAKQVTALGALYPKWKQTVIDQILMSDLLGQPITVFQYLEKKHAQLLHATRYELGESMETHLSCSLVANTFCQTSVKEEI
jgi:translation elongation factor EF-Ts